MGVFLNVLTAPGASEKELSALLSDVDKASAKDWNLDAASCQIWKADKGAGAILNDFCAGYEEMTRRLSQMRGGPLMLCYIYDDDAWGYYFYDGGWEVDSFCTVPDLLEEVTPKERRRLSGCSAALASYFPARPEQLDPYLTFWEEGEGDAWQMADFLDELGYPLPEEEPEAPPCPEEDPKRDYPLLVQLAQKNSPTGWDEASLIDFCKIISVYSMDHIPEKPVRSGLIQRDTEDLRLLVLFLQQYPLPDGLYRLIWQTLELKNAQYGRAAVLYGELRRQLLSLRPELCQLAPRSYDALRVELIRALSGRGETEKALDALFARPDFAAAFFDDSFVLSTFVWEQPYYSPANSPLFLARMITFYEQNPAAPYADILRPRFEAALVPLRQKQRRKEEALAAVPRKVPGFGSMPFFFYWLNALCCMKELPVLYKQLRRQADFDLDWGRRFVGLDETSGLPGFQKLFIPCMGQRIQVRFHLRYLEFFRGRKPITQACFTLEELEGLQTPEHFFYLLPLMAPVEDPAPLVREMARRLGDAAPFLTGTECRVLARKLAKGFVYSPERLSESQQLVRFLWEEAENDPDLDPDELLFDWREELPEDAPAEPAPGNALLLRCQALCEETDCMEELLPKLFALCEGRADELSRWLFYVLKEWEELRRKQQAMTEEEKRAAFLASLPQQLFWENYDKLFCYRCILDQGQLFPEMLCQDPKTGAFCPVNSAKGFFHHPLEVLPAGPKLRKELLERAQRFFGELACTSYVFKLAQLPETVFIDPDPQKAQDDRLTGLPRLLHGSDLLPKQLDKLLGLFRQGLLLRLELCWDSSVLVDEAGNVAYASGGRPISLVLMRDGDKWACFLFDDMGPNAYQLVRDLDSYLTIDFRSVEAIPFAYGTVPAHSVFYEPEPLLAKLPKLFSTVTSRRPDFQAPGFWSTIASSVYYNREKYTLDKRILGGFAPQRAYNALTTRFYLKDYPSAIEALPQKGDVQRLVVSAANRDLPRSFLERFFGLCFQKLVLHFEPGLHLVLMREHSHSRMVLLDDEGRRAFFAVSDSASPAPGTQPVPVSFFGRPAAAGLVFEELIFLRSSTELLLTCWKNRETLLADPRLFAPADPCRPCAYEELRAELLSF